MDQPIKEPIDHTWHQRPVFFVSDIRHAITFYVDKLGFKKKWHEGDGTGTVCQVDRGGCEIILCEDATRKDRGHVFLELSRKGVDHLLKEVEGRSIPTQKMWWGYDVLRIEDPDGNDLLVCLENLLSGTMAGVLSPAPKHNSFIYCVSSDNTRPFGLSSTGD